VGLKVTLDNDGYKTVAALDSPLNMKRFICRVVDKINCVVNDEKSLMSFVPYSTASHEDYAGLETELGTICHGEGKWVIPK
jgi:hypothetical protein